ncbi:MAG: hypothetical protein ABIT04_07785 [Novosphingobium sp.]
MDAPLYPPAAVYIQPARLPRLLTTRDTPIGVLQRIPAAWAIVLKEAPNIERSVGSPQMKPHLNNFSFTTLISFGIVKPDALARIDAQLKALGEVQ